MNYIDYLKKLAKEYGNRNAIVDNDGSRKITYFELNKLTSQIASKLHGLNINKGDTVIINLPRCYEYIASFIGIHKAGCIAICVVSDYPNERIKYIESDSNSKLTITEKFFDDIDSYDEYEDICKDDEGAVLVYTSGSTGKPKGILHTMKDFSYAIDRFIPVYKDLNNIEDKRHATTVSMAFAANAFDTYAPLCMGSTVYITSDIVRKSNINLSNFIRLNSITSAYISPQLLKIFNNTSKSLKVVISASERLSNVYSEDYKIINAYGMSEEYIVTCFEVDKKYENTPIGKGLDGVEMLILDENNKEVKKGQEGEICAKLVSNTIYYKDPDRTNRIMNKTDDGKTIIHSGDIGYINEDGNIVYVNRKDWMVKVNGQRVEMLEIESLIKEDTRIKDAIVHFFFDKDQQTYLVAYYISSDDIGFELKKNLENKLPPYMIPRFFVKIDEIPKNINGKVNREALKEPKASDYKVEYVGPTNNIEKLLCMAFEEVLGCQKVGINDDFFMLGGDSIKTMKLITETGLEGLNREIILTEKTPKKIALKYKNNKDSIKHNDEILDSYPLTGSQKGVYLECLNDLDSTMYNIPFYVVLPKDIEVNKFIESIKKVASRHNAFNVTFDIINGEAKMLYKKNDIVVENIDIESFDFKIKEFVKPFDLKNGPLYRFEIWNDSKNNYFVYDVHHLIFDGTSVQVFLREIFDDYNKIKINEEKLNVFDIALNEININKTKKYENAIKFFDEKFNGIDCNSLPVPDVVEEIDNKNSEMISIDSNELLDKQKVENYSKENGITESTLFMYGFAYTLSKYNGVNNSLFCTVNNGRHDSRLSNSIGMFVRTVPVYFEFNEDSIIKDDLLKTQDYLYETFDNDIVDIGELVHKYELNTSIQFVYQSDTMSFVEFNGKQIENKQIPLNNLAGDIQVMVHKLNNSYLITASYLTSKYTNSFIEGFVESYIKVINDIVNAFKLKDIELVSSKAKGIIDRFNQTKVEYDTEHTIVDLFRKMAKENPNNECVVYKESKYTYKQVDELSDKLAQYLVNNGIKKETVTGILINRNEYMVIASLGVLKAGGAYMPLDPSYPKERLNFMVNDADTIMLITEESLNDVIDDSYKGNRLFISEINELKDEANLMTSVPSPKDRFIMLYTSGTTGTPKGVIYEHANVMCLADWLRKFFNCDSSTKRAVYASYGFDANVFDTYGVLTSGGSLHIIDEDIRLDLKAIQKYFNDNKITDAVMTTQVGRQFALMPGTKTLRELSVAGEALTPLEPLNEFKLYNLYGPSETTVLVTQFLVDKKYRNIPIGRAIDNVKLYVVDKNNKLLPVGAIGELVVSGPHVTRGYLNRPDKTSEVFGLNTYINEPGYERLYHTGDVVRLMSDGNIQFIGRNDMQVKIRGFRVELTEVEEVIRRFEGIKDATVVAFNDDNGGKYLCAYVVSDEKIDEKAIKEFIKGEKPPYMVPPIIMQIDKIPLNQNQKVNRKALPVPNYKSEEIVKPENEVQQKIFDIVSNVIGHKNFGVDSDIYDVGLSSIGTVKLNYDLAEAFNISIKTSDISTNSTIRKLEKLLTTSHSEEIHDIQNDYPLTKTQQGIFVECISKPNETVYNIPVLFKVSNSISIDKLEKAIIDVVDAHPYIKTTLFNDANGDVRAKRNDDSKVLIESLKVNELPKLEEMVKPFQMIESPLYRMTIYQTKDGNYLFMDLNHIIADGTSEAIILNDLSKAVKGEKITKEKYTGFELSLDEEKIRKSDLYDKAKIYYEDLLKDSEPDCLPPKTLDSKENGSSKIIKELDVDVETIKKYCAYNNVTENALFNSIFGYLLAEFTHKENVTYTTIHNGRNDSRLKDSVMMLVKTIPVFMTIDGNLETISFVNEIQKQLVKSMHNDSYSFAEISNQFGIKSDIIFVYQGSEYSVDALSNEYISIVKTLEQDAKAPISFELSIINNKFVVKFDYHTELYNQEFVESFIESFDKATSEFINKKLIKEISILSDSSKRFLDSNNETSFDYYKASVDKVIEKQVDLLKDKIAVISNSEKITFNELNIKANRIANSLIKLGVKKDDIVGLILDRSVNVVVGEVGILKSGGAFLPMPPSYPDDRISYCLDNSESKFVITSKSLKEEKKDLFSSNKNYKTLTIEELLEESNSANPNLDIPMDSLAYCIYTSGSTGNPKGVMIEHHNMSNFIQTYDGSLAINKGIEGNALCMSSISFDMSIFEMYCALACGRSIVIATDEEIHNLQLLNKLMIDNDVSTIVCTPSFITNMLGIEEFESSFKNCKSILLGAEALTNAIVSKLRKISPSIIICNGYGPTETTVGCSACVVSDNKPITIGRPSHNVKYYVIDRFGNALPKYAQGELIICGEGVGRGYIKLPEKNATSFFKMYDTPAYHSGDIVRFDKNGECEFFGRSDNQVKLRGFRVELDEIEKAFCSYDGIKQSKVIVRNNGSEDYLAGFFTANKEIDLDDLRSHLKKKLTYYMVPASMMQLEKMPLNASGKIDKKALPEIKVSKSESKKKRAPKKSTEEMLCEVFKDVLGLQEYYVDDDFFESGGTSLTASKLTMKLMSQGIEIQYQDVFDNPTPEMLAEVIDKSKNKVEVKEEKTTNESNYSDVLKYNSLNYAAEVTREELGDVLLSGAAGFLGIHILAEIITSEKGHVYCLVRKGKYNDSRERLMRGIFYYFDDIDEKQFDERITVIDADITDDLSKVLKDYSFDTIINCAAIVKHYAADDSIENVNVKGVERLIDIAMQRKARLIQISTTSIPGAHTDETYHSNLKMHENEHFVINNMDNKYIISKYDAECRMFDAIKKGLRGKVIRVGNLMGRYSDGEFQINITTNAFLKALKGFATLGICPIGHSTDPMSYSPVDLTAKVVVLLAGTADRYTVFHGDSRYGFDEYKLIDACNRCGIKIERVEDKKYYDEYYEKLGDEKLNERLSGLVTNDRPDLHMVETDNKFTANVLYRLGFEWPFTDVEYLNRTIESIKTLGFFDYEEELKGEDL